jgi:hypothetical protein
MQQAQKGTELEVDNEKLRAKIVELESQNRVLQIEVSRVLDFFILFDTTPQAKHLQSSMEIRDRLAKQAHIKLSGQFQKLKSQHSDLQGKYGDLQQEFDN